MTADAEHDLLPPLPERPVPVWPGEQWQLGRRSLFVRHAEGPDAETAVFVHGLGGASTNWTDLMYLLRGRLDCFAPDLPGFGFSEEPPPGRRSAADYSLDSHVEAVVALLEQLGAPVHLFGNSLGGTVCTRIAAQRPDLVRTLSLISPALPVLRPRKGTDPRLIFLLIPAVGQWASRRTRLQPAESRVRELMELCYGEPMPIPVERIAEAVTELERRRGLEWFDTALMASLRGLARSYFEIGQRRLWAQARRIQAPTLIVWGRLDRLVSVSLAGRTQAAIKGSRLVVLQRCGHVSMLEDPVRVAREFLALT